MNTGSLMASRLEPVQNAGKAEVHEVPQVVSTTSPTPHVKELSKNPLKRAKIRQDTQYEKEGKRWVRRRDNSRFAANPHIVKPTALDFGIDSPSPLVTFPNPLPPFLPRHLAAPSTLTPHRDPVSANAGRYSLSLKGVRRELRKSRPRCEQIVLDIEQELTQWLHSGGILLSPDDSHQPILPPGTSLGSSGSITEVFRSPTELIWRVEDPHPRWLVHCVARFYGVVSFSKPALEGDVRLTHLLRPNVTRPDFIALGILDTPPPSDIDTFSVIVDTEDSDAASEHAFGFEGNDAGFFSPLSILPEEHDHGDPASGRRYRSGPTNEIDSLVGGEREDDNESLSLSIDSLSLAEDSGDWEQTYRRRAPRGASSPSRSDLFVGHPAASHRHP